MKRTLGRIAALVVLAACVGLVLPADAADRRTRPRHPALNLPTDIVEVAWSQVVTAAATFFPVLRIVHPAPNPPDPFYRARQTWEQPRHFALPGLDRDVDRSRERPRHPMLPVDDRYLHRSRER